MIKRQGAKNWIEVSRFHNLSDQEILDALQPKAKLQRGFRCENQSAFLVLHIPAQSPYHNAASVTEIRQSLAKLAAYPRHYQIDEHWYLYIFLSRQAPISELVKQLRYWCLAEGLVLGPDTLNLHPGESALPFPLQGDFTWLNERCQLLVRRNELSLEDALAFFLDDAGKATSDPDQLLQALVKSAGFLQNLLKNSEDRHAVKKDNVIALISDRMGASEPEQKQNEQKQKRHGEIDLEFQNNVLLEEDDNCLVIFKEENETGAGPAGDPTDSAQLLLFPGAENQAACEVKELEQARSSQVKKRKKDKGN